MDRGPLPRLGGAGIAGTVGATLTAGPAAAASPPPAPQGDDIGVLSFGAVAETASAAWFERAPEVPRPVQGPVPCRPVP